MADNFNMVAKTLYGFEELLARELKQLGGGNIKPGVRNVAFTGDTGFMYKANLCLRTALRILKTMDSFYLRNENDLYQKVYRMDWPQHISPDTTFAIDATLNSDLFTHSLYVSQKVKDAIVDKVRATTDKRPNVDVKSPDIKINVHIRQNRCNIALDSSGESLHQRGYRTATNIAPMNEVLAAGLLLMSGWDGRTDFLDPMCGSGTLLIEAATIACNIPANINRQQFAFQNWPDYDESLFDKITEACLNRTREFHHSIVGYDKAPSAVRKCEDNIENANLSEYITVERLNFFKTQKKHSSKLHMVFNPPYGERLTVNFREFYKAIGDTLKQYYPNTEAWFVTSNLEALKYVGLRPSRKIKVLNSQLESRLAKYEIYEGSKKAKYNRGME